MTLSQNGMASIEIRSPKQISEQSSGYEVSDYEEGVAPSLLTRTVLDMLAKAYEAGLIVGADEARDRMFVACRFDFRGAPKYPNSNPARIPCRDWRDGGQPVQKTLLRTLGKRVKE